MDYYIVHGQEILPFVCEKSIDIATAELADKLGYAWFDIGWRFSDTGQSIVIYHNANRRVLGITIPHSFPLIEDYASYETPTERVQRNILQNVGECLAGMDHSEVSRYARNRIKQAINRASEK